MYLKLPNFMRMGHICRNLSEESVDTSVTELYSQLRVAFFVFTFVQSPEFKTSWIK